MLNHIYSKDHPKGVPKKEVKRIMKKIDVNHDGKIGKEEFYLFYKGL